VDVKHGTQRIVPITSIANAVEARNSKSIRSLARLKTNEMAVMVKTQSNKVLELAKYSDTETSAQSTESETDRSSFEDDAASVKPTAYSTKPREA
jgi:hypothetical protein